MRKHPVKETSKRDDGRERVKLCGIAKTARKGPIYGGHYMRLVRERSRVDHSGDRRALVVLSRCMAVKLIPMGFILFAFAG